MTTAAPFPAAVPVDPALERQAVGAEQLGYMRQALAAAEAATARGEVPVGAVIVAGGAVIAVARNERETANDPTARAEVLALRRAAAALGSWRLADAELYEP